MTEADPTCIGRVRNVLGPRVIVALDSHLAGVSPIYKGRLQPIGQVGTLVRLPQGLVDLIATVTLVSISELASTPKVAETFSYDERWLQVDLLGEINRATGTFVRGVTTYPGLDDPVHFATAEQLSSIFPAPDDSLLQFGTLSTSEDIPVCIDVARLVLRHSAIVGSTGSGKTSTIAALLQRIVEAGWQSANVVVIDPHGEYAKAMTRGASHRSVLGDGQDSLRVPYWALASDDILQVFLGTQPGHAMSSRFAQLVTAERRKYASESSWLDLELNTITSDTPVPFDLREVWYRLEYENRETLNDKQDSTSSCLLDPGDPQSLSPPEFEPHSPHNSAPFKGNTFGQLGNGPALLRLGLLDHRLEFFQHPFGYGFDTDPLADVVSEWLGNSEPISILNFDGVPDAAAQLAIGVILNLLFEIAVRSEPEGDGIGRPQPVLIILEEAHRYIGSNALRFTRESANRIAREGRKYGVGLMLASQRPTELPATALSQVGTVVALRLTNSEDQAAVRSALPDAGSALASALPSLRTGEAVISGEGVVLPSRARVLPPNPFPSSEDPSLRTWRKAGSHTCLRSAISSWRGSS